MTYVKSEKNSAVDPSAMSLPIDEKYEVSLPKDFSSIQEKELIFNEDGFPWRDIAILDNDRPAYFCDVAEFKRPDISLHEGAKDGPVVGAAHFRWSRHIKCGVGSDDISMVWTEMKRHGTFGPKRYRFEWNGKQCILQRASSAEHGGTGLSRMLLTHFKVQEERSGKILALYVSETGFGKKKGTLRIAPGVESSLEKIIVLGVASWRDQMRRTAQYSTSGGGS